MTVFEAIDFSDHEQVVYASDAASGLRAIIAVHDTRLGPGMGGCRAYEYPDENSALRDVLRLSKGMTYKSAVAGVHFGGGKAVILLEPGQPKTEALVLAMGRAIERLGGRYITGEDIGTTPQDMSIMLRVTKHVLGASPGDGGSGDPSPSTALGCFEGLKASVRYRLGSESLEGVTVAVQGLGKVGWYLCERLHAAEARLIVADINSESVTRAVETFGAQALDAEEIYDANADVFAPCAMGAILNSQTIPRLRATVVAGAANNQLDRPEHGTALQQRGILYAPDYVINGGGVIQLEVEHDGYDATEVERRVCGIASTLSQIFESADAEGITTHEAADRLAEARLEAASG